MSDAEQSVWPFWLGGAAVSAVVIAVAIWLFGPADTQTDPGAAPDVAVVEPAAPTPVVQSPPAEEEAQAEDVTAAAPAEDTTDAQQADDEQPARALPRLAELRLESDGLAVIAGTATPFSEVILRANGAEVARTLADTMGSFATVAFLEPDPRPRVLTLVEIDASGAEILSPDELILAPVAAPIEVAQQEPLEESVAPDAPEAAAEPEPSTEDVAAAEPVAVAEPDPAPESTPVPATDPAPVTATDAATGPSTDPAPDTTTSQDTAVASEAEPEADNIEIAAVAAADTGDAAQPKPAEPAVAEPSKPDVTVEDTAVASTSDASLNASTEETPETNTDTARASGQTQNAATQEVAGSSQSEVTAEPIETAPASDEVAAVEPEPLAADPIQDPTVRTVAQAPDTKDTDPVLATTPAEPKPLEVPKQAAPAPAPQQQAPQQVAILKSNEDGVEVIRPAAIAPSAMTQVALDAISYSVEGEVQLSGRAQGSATEVRVYLNNKSVAALDVDDTGGWRGALPDIDTGVYTLRIDEVDSSGKVTSRVETPFKRESAEVLVASTDPDAPVAAITVQKGATLWAIARERYGEGTLYVKVFEANRGEITDPDLIYPGQVFTLPTE